MHTGIESWEDAPLLDGVAPTIPSHPFPVPLYKGILLLLPLSFIMYKFGTSINFLDLWDGVVEQLHLQDLRISSVTRFAWGLTF